MHKKEIGIAVIALLVGFGAGYYMHPAAPASVATGYTGTRGGTGMRSGSATGGFISGTVATEDAGSITVNTRDGSSHVVLVTPATTISKSVNGTLSDVAIGATVMVSGTTNSDGSVSAGNIQLRPTPPAQ